MENLDREGFTEWLYSSFPDKPKKLVGDMISRANRVEKAFQEIHPHFSLDKEYKKDGGKSLGKKLLHYGKALEGTGVNLPIGNIQMYPIRHSVKWYFKYLSEKQGNNK